MSVQHALEILDVLGLVSESGMVQQICDYLLTITCPSGGVPWLLPSAMNYPRAPWWQTDANPPASLNPTAAIAGLLHKNNVQHEWLAQATEYCWSEIEKLSPSEMHSMGVVLTFLYHVPNRLRATAQLDRVIDLMLAGDLVADIDAEGYVRKPLDSAPLPNHPLRRYFSQTMIEANLDAIIAAQEVDGGWGVPWKTLSPACELEWRGWITVDKLQILRANGRI